MGHPGLRDFVGMNPLAMIERPTIEGNGNNEQAVREKYYEREYNKIAKQEKDLPIITNCHKRLMEI